MPINALLRVPLIGDTSIPRTPLSKWNVTFDGTTSITDFLKRVKELRFSRRVSKQQLLVSAVEIFTGRALIWLRSMRNRIHTWDDLVVELRETPFCRVITNIRSLMKLEIEHRVRMKRSLSTYRLWKICLVD